MPCPRMARTASRLPRRRLLSSLSAEHTVAPVVAPTNVPRRRERAPSSSSEEPRPLFDDRDDVEHEVGAVIRRPTGYSFGGGPGAVRDVVKQRAAVEMLEGGLLEMSHRERGPVHALLVSTQDLIRDLMSVPKNYAILFIQGGAHAQFAAVPLNFGQAPRAVSCITGSWSLKASAEQGRFARMAEHRPTSLERNEDVLQGFVSALNVEGADYGYVCTNETMQGVQLTRDDLLAASKTPIVADSTSDLFSRAMDISKYGVVFASGGKNLGPAGFAVVLVKDDILRTRTASPTLPSIMSWKEHAESKPVQNLYNTPPMLSIGVAKMVLDDLAARGGVQWAERRSAVLSQAIYDEVDASGGFYRNDVAEDVRSRVSVVFGIPGNRSLEARFVAQAEARGLLQLINHPSVGGMRASVYNAVPVRAVEILVKFMREFKKEHDA